MRHDFNEHEGQDFQERQFTYRDNYQAEQPRDDGEPVGELPADNF